jgi:integrase
MAKGKPVGRVYRPKGRDALMLAYYGPKPDGSWGQIRESAKTMDEAEARRRLAQRLRKVEAHREGQAGSFEVPAQRRVKVGELLDELLAFYQSREIKSLDSVRLRVRAEGPRGTTPPLRAAFGDLPAVKVTTARVEAYARERKAAGMANATVNRDVELLGHALRLGQERGRIARAPKMPAKLPEARRSGFFEKAHLDALLPRLPEPLGEMTRFAFATGWRRGELLGLRWEWVDRQAGEIRLPDSKNGEARTLPLDADLSELIERRWQAREYATASGPALSAYVFHRRGVPINRTTFGKQWRKACKAAGLAGRLFHDLRRSAARAMIRGGAPQSVAMRVGGWKTSAVFTRYDISDNRDKLEALKGARAYTDAEPGASNVVRMPKA